jgi:phthalate 4,5-cis-dihydrodiol dehydrogenase
VSSAPDERVTTIRLGIVGLGGAAVSMLPSIIAHDGIRIAGAADPSTEGRERFARDFEVATYATAEELCTDSSIDAVYVATPHELHARHTILAVESGKHVLVEKPMALSLGECEAMCAAAAHNDVHIVVGPTHSFDRPILRMREIIRSGELGRVAMVNTWNFGNFLYRPRRPEELDTSKGGGVVFNQLPHQVDIVRLLGGGLVRSVRSMVWALDPARPTEGSHATYLEFVDGAAATLVYSGYDFFDTDEFCSWRGEEGMPKEPDQHGRARRALGELSAPDEERALKASRGYAGAPELRSPSTPASGLGHPHFGVVVASCERGDLRPGGEGVLVYDEHGRREIPVPRGPAFPDKGAVLDQLYDAVVHGTRPLHNGSWGKATMEVCLAILSSARERREVYLSHQAPLEDAPGR